MARRKSFTRAFIKLTREGIVIPGSVVVRAEKPKLGNWREITNDYCCPPTTTTTTTSSSTTTTTTT